VPLADPQVAPRQLRLRHPLPPNAHPGNVEHRDGRRGLPPELQAQGRRGEGAGVPHLADRAATLHRVDRPGDVLARRQQEGLATVPPDGRTSGLHPHLAGNQHLPAPHLVFHRRRMVQRQHRHHIPQDEQSVLSYAWICIHAGLGATAWILERRLRKVEISLREIEDADVLSRWGQVSRLPGYTSLNGTSFGTGGLTPLEINDLPIMRAAIPELGEDTECPICLYELKPGDNVRQLSMCGHTFHRSCIDLWLLRRADCPLCKRSVRSAAGGGDGKVGAASGV